MAGIWTLACGAGCRDGARRRENTSTRGRSSERMNVDTRITAPGVAMESDARWRPWGRSPRRNPKGPSRTLLVPARAPSAPGVPAVGIAPSRSGDVVAVARLRCRLAVGARDRDGGDRPVHGNEAGEPARSSAADAWTVAGSGEGRRPAARASHGATGGVPGRSRRSGRRAEGTARLGARRFGGWQGPAAAAAA